MGRLLSSLFITVFLATTMRAQTTVTPTVRMVNPEDADPGYAARKALRATPQGTRVAAQRRSGPVTPGRLPACFEPLDATYTVLPRNDDNSTGLISLPFAFSLFGTSYTGCYVNNNGNISFNQPVFQYDATGFPAPEPMVAAFWGDVDTTPPGSGLVYYKVFPDRLVVTWDHVFYYGNNSTLNNTFQIIIRRNTGGFNPSPDVSFAYGDMQWTTGAASGGTAGFGSTPATVGINQGGSPGNYIQTGRFNLDDATPPQASYPAGATTYSGVNWLDNQCIGYTIAPAGNLPPTATGFPAGNTLLVRVGQTVNLPLQFAGPEADQTVTVAPDLTGLCNSSAPVGPGTNPIVNFTVTGAACNLGTHTVTFVATDNGTPIMSKTIALTVIVTAPIQWSGAVSSAYSLPGNWTGNVVPGATDDVSIPAGVPNFPVLTATAAANSCTVASGASMTIGPGGDLTLTGTLANNGTFQGTAGILRTTGTAVQMLGGSGAAFALGELNVGGSGAQLASALTIAKILILNGDLTTNGQSLQLLSSATGTAMVVNNGSAVVAGNATVQRYISPILNPGAGYRHFAAPVTGVNAASLTRPGYTPVVNMTYNTMGSSVTPFPNVFGYDQSRVTTSGSAGSTDFDRGYFSPAATTTPFADGRGFTVNMAANAAATPVSFTGTLHNGPYNPGILARGGQTESGWHLLGNPYPAPLDWSAAFAGATGLQNAVYVFKSSGQYAGSYDSFVNNIGTARYIGVGQGFFVHVNTPNSTGQLNLTNAARVTTYQDPAFNRAAPGTGDQRPQLRLDLVSNGQTDATYVYFENGATSGFDRAYDAYKLPGGNPLYLASGDAAQSYSINGLPMLTPAGANVPLMIYLPQAGSFELRLGDLRNFGAATLQLEDRRTGTWYDLRQQPGVTFQASTATEAATRFTLHVNQQRALGMNAALAPEAVSVWPNPASGIISLNVTALPASNSTLNLSLLNMLGQVVARQSVAVRAGSAATTVDVTGLAPGVYMLKGNTSTHSFTRSVVVH